MKQFKKQIAGFMVLVISISTVSFANATNISDAEFNTMQDAKQTEIQNLIQDIARINLDNIVSESELKINEMIAKNIEKTGLLSELESLGVEKLSSEEIYEISGTNQGKEINPPDSTYETEWFSWSFSRRVNGVTYNCQEITATGMNTGSSLVKMTDEVLYANAISYVDLYTDLVYIYAQKAIGQVPLIGWLPYEFGFPSIGEKYIGEKLELGTITNSVISFIYVEDRLCFMSNAYETTIIINGRGIKDGKHYVQHESNNFRDNSDQYGSASKAVDVYVSGRNSARDYIPFFKTDVQDGKYVSKKYLPNPGFPSQIN